jgi:hypothetical protein
MHGKCNSARQIGRSGLHIGVRLHHVPCIVIGIYLDKETGDEYKYRNNNTSYIAGWIKT